MNPAHQHKIANRKFRRLVKLMAEERRQMRSLTSADVMQKTHDKVTALSQQLSRMDGDSFRVWAARHAATTTNKRVSR